MDTLRYYESLVAAGSNETEAKAHVYGLKDTLDNLVTKNDLEGAIKILAHRLDIIEKIGGSFCIAMLILLMKVAIWG